jgi:hypothetical protein
MFVVIGGLVVSGDVRGKCCIFRDGVLSRGSCCNVV